MQILRNCSIGVSYKVQLQKNGLAYWTSSNTTLVGWYIRKSRTIAARTVKRPSTWKSEPGRRKISLSVTPSDVKSLGFMIPFFDTIWRVGDRTGDLPVRLKIFSFGDERRDPLEAIALKSVQ